MKVELSIIQASKNSNGLSLRVYLPREYAGKRFTISDISSVNGTFVLEPQTDFDFGVKASTYEGYDKSFLTFKLEKYTDGQFVDKAIAITEASGNDDGAGRIFVQVPDHFLASRPKREAIAGYDDLFVSEGHRTHRGGKGNPRWLQRQGDHDFITLDSSGDIPSFVNYMNGNGDYTCDYYDVYTTGLDRNGNSMIQLWQDGGSPHERGDKVATIIITDKYLAMDMVDLINENCGKESAAA